MSDCAWCEPDEPCVTCVWDGPPPPPPDRAVGGYAYLMCEDAVPKEADK